MTNKIEELYVYAPIDGQVKELASLNDGVFSEKLLGEGCVINPIGETIVSPFDGTIVMEIETKHAIGLESKEGIEVLLHIGIDTVMMEGKGFKMLVKKDDVVKKGQPLLTFSKEEIKKAGYCDDVVIIVSNSKKFKDVLCLDRVNIEKEEELIKIIL